MNAEKPFDKLARALWAPADALIRALEEEQLEYSARRMGTAVDKGILVLAIAMMACDTYMGRISHPLTLLLAFWSLFNCAFGDRVRQLRPDLDPKHRYAPDEGENGKDGQDGDHD